MALVGNSEAIAWLNDVFLVLIVLSLKGHRHAKWGVFTVIFMAKEKSCSLADSGLFTPKIFGEKSNVVGFISYTL